MGGNQLKGVPSTLSHLTRLSHLDLSLQSLKFQLREPLAFLSAMPRLVLLALQPQPLGHEWDLLSVFHIAQALEVARRGAPLLKLDTAIFWAAAPAAAAAPPADSVWAQRGWHRL